jgi:hypothetical protein
VKKRFALGAALTLLAYAARARAQAAAPAPETLAVGDWQLAPVLEVRARGEYRHDLDTGERGLLVERARLGVDALRGAVEARVVLQDARVMDLGAGNELVGGPMPMAFTGAYEAWGEAHTGSVRPSFVRAGRQRVAWGEGRLLGTADWSAAARSLDAVRGRLVVGDGSFELLAAVLVDPASGASLQPYGELFGARAEWAFDPALAFEAYGLARLAQAEPAANLEGTVEGQTYTAAARLHGDARAWTWGAEGAFQFGHVDAAPAASAPMLVAAKARGAWAAAGHVGYAFERVLLRPAARVGVAYASGDDGGSTYRTFDPLLPDVHTWHGAMDLFAWSNEEEASARVSAVPWTDAIATLEYRYVRLAQPGAAWLTGNLTTIRRAPGNTRAELGHEIDATLAWSPWAPVEFSAGYSALILGDGARAILAANGFGANKDNGGVSPAAVSHLAYAQVLVAIP